MAPRKAGAPALDFGPATPARDRAPMAPTPTSDPPAMPLATSTQRRALPCPEGGLYPGPTTGTLTKKELAAIMRKKAWKAGIAHAEEEMALGVAAGRGKR